MSQQGNLYPNMEQSKKGPPLPGTYVHVQQQPDHWSVESPRTPLIQGAPQYAIYNPKRAIVYAKKSKSHCCCVVGCVLCTFCCCLFFLISVILGGLVAAYAVQCGKVASDQVVFSSSLSNVTQLQFINYNGPISLSSSFDAENVTITVTRRAANSDEISRFTSIFNVENGQLYFEEQLPGKNNFWEAVINCVSSQIDIVFPAHLDQPLSLTVTSRNGDVSIDVTSRFAQAVLSTSNGDIHLNLSSDSISATTTNGNIDLASVSTKSLTGETTNGNVKSDGNITLVGVNETVTFDVSTTNGHIDISSLIASSRATIQMESTNGDVSAVISRFAGSFDVKTTNGGTTVIGDQVHFTNQERKEKQGTVGNGLGSCNLSSTNGDVTATFS